MESSVWRSRNLKLIGKSEESYKKIENVFIHFLWNGKPPNFKLFTLEILTVNGGLQFPVNGGLQFPVIRKIDKIMKAS